MWNKSEISILTKEYPIKGKDYCMRLLNKTEGQIRSFASKLGLKQDRNSDFFKEWQSKAKTSKIGKKRPEHSVFMKQYIKDNPKFKYWSKERRRQNGIRSKKRILENGHPKGMLGKNHSDTTRKILSEKFKLNWKNPKSKHNSKEYRQNISNRQSIIMQKRLSEKGSIYSRSNNGWYLINGNKFYFRSGWEVVYARYLEWLKNKGQIHHWEYEPDTLWFHKILRGVRSYKPDFKVFNDKSDDFEYHEVKGWLDPKSKTKLKRVKKYYPKLKVVLIDKDVYKSIKNMERLYPEATLVS